jgi:hypothetical protein
MRGPPYMSSSNRSTGVLDDGFYASHQQSVLIINGQHTTVKYDTLSQLPLLYTKPGICSFLAFQDSFMAASATAVSTVLIGDNLSKSQRHKKYLHELCAHESYSNLNRWIRMGVFPGIDQKLAAVPDPVCPACAFGKARRVCHKTHNGHIADGHTKPGDGVSSDGLESGTPGRPFTTKGSSSKLCYNYVSLWVDHMSTYVYVTLHASKAATELVRSKLEFKTFAARYNVKIKNIRADNGVYSANLFREACLRGQQNLSFCGVEAHWQNGIAERFIGTITQRARTILLHAMAKWPDVIKEDMWTFALHHAVHFHNSSIRKDKTITPYEAFTGQVPRWSISDFRVWGSPTYILQNELQDGSSINRWKPRSWTGVYVGNSTCHSSGIPLIYNPTTSHISPQFHVIYDENFHSVSRNSTMDPEAYLEQLYDTSARWLHKDEFSDEVYPFESLWDDTHPTDATRKRKNPPLSSTGLRGSSLPHTPQRSYPASTSRGSSSPLPAELTSEAPHSGSSPALDTHPASTSRSVDGDPAIHLHAVLPTDDTTLTEREEGQPTTQEHHGLHVATAAPDPPAPAHDGANITPTRHFTTARPQYVYDDRTEYYRAYKRQRGIYGAILVLASSHSSYFESPTPDPPAYPHLANIFAAYPTLPAEFSDTPLHAFTIVDNKADTLTQSQMLKTADKAAFIATPKKELEGLIKMGVFDIKHMSTKPSDAQLLSSIWSYRRKRSPIGTILKHKSRICVDGSQQEYGRDYWDVYAPVVSWPTV